MSTVLLDTTVASSPNGCFAPTSRRNGRSVFGLMEALKAQKKTHQAMLVKQQFDAAWKNADTKLTLDLF
jgi:hypothetical protein